MNFDFPAIMVIAVLFTGVVWLLDIWLWAPKRHAAVERAGAGMSDDGGRK